MSRSASLCLVVFAGVWGCVPPPQANPEFNDAALYVFAQVESPEPAALAYAVRAFEREIYLAVDVDASSAAERSLTPAELTLSDVAGIEEIPGLYPEGTDRAGEVVDPSNALPLAIARHSAYEPAAHVPYLVLPDQTGTEPGSPEHYDRSFVDGTDVCWPTRECEFLRTDNSVTKTNLALTITYDLYKDYRWVDLNLPDPASVSEGQPLVNEGAPRWAVVARSWNPAVAQGGNNYIFQSYSVELWLPRDGGGFVRDGSATNVGDGTWTGDSEGGGSLRLMALWAESSIGDSALVAVVTRNGIDDLFKAQDEWLDSPPEGSP